VRLRCAYAAAWALGSTCSPPSESTTTPPLLSAGTLQLTCTADLLAGDDSFAEQSCENYAAIVYFVQA
jgi:hypothetical protein